MRKIELAHLVVLVLVTLFGLLMVYDSSSVIAFEQFGDKYNYIKDQLVWAMIGYTGFIFFYFFDYRKLFNFALPALLGALVLLFLVFIPGIGSEAKGASRWINIASFRLQPAEFVKLSLALYFAAWFSQKEKGRFLAFSLLLGAILLLVMLQPDMGTASIILVEAITVYFLSGGSLLYFAAAIPVILGGGYLLIKSAPYRAARLASFLQVDRSIEDASYHVRQILIALGSGGLFGLGVGNSIQKYSYLPESVTDSIFPIIAEEFGFVGSLILILALMFIVWRGFYIAATARDKFGKLLAGGIMSFIGAQILINLAAMTILLPLTGVPLPFISYGGSALIVNLSAMGIVFNISRQSHY